MIKRAFGPKHWQVPIIGQGTWNFPTANAAIEEAKIALRRGLDLGMTHIDTAEMYGSGQSEEIIAEAIKGLPRHDLFIVSKVLPGNASYRGTITACEQSLKRLKTDYLDCYLLHWRGDKSLEHTMRALEKLVVDGKIHSFGVSNFDVNDLEEAQQFLQKEQIACNQVLYNLAHRGIERQLLGYCKDKAITVVGYKPFGQVPAKNSATYTVLETIADKHAATLRQVILAFLVRDKDVFAIPKAAQVSHTEENAKAADIVLDQTDINALNKAFPIPHKDVPLAMV